MKAKGKSAAPAAEATIDIMEVTHGVMHLCVLGTSPLVYNRMSEKAKRELLLPKGRKNAADRAASLKHEPLEEYRASVYRSRDDNGPTRLQLPTPMFKGCMLTAALDMPGTYKSTIGRLVHVIGERVDVYGVPALLMSVVRSAGMNRTPDIRTRAILGAWACRVEVRFTKPHLNDKAVANLLASGGMNCGVGDWRLEKGKGSYGGFRLCDADDPEFLKVIESGGRAAQDAALEAAEPYDDETEELLRWYSVETNRRGIKVAS